MPPSALVSEQPKTGSGSGRIHPSCEPDNRKRNAQSLVDDMRSKRKLVPDEDVGCEFPDRICDISTLKAGALGPVPKPSIKTCRPVEGNLNIGKALFIQPWRCSL